MKQPIYRWHMTDDNNPKVNELYDYLTKTELPIGRNK